MSLTTVLYLKLLESIDRQYFQSEEFDDLENRIEVLESAPIGDLSQIQSDVTSLQSSQTTQDSSILSLQGTSMVQTTNIANNTSAISALDTRVTQNETDIANLGGGGGGSSPANIAVEDNGVELTSDVISLNFVGFNLTEPLTDQITVTAIPTDLTSVNNGIAANTSLINTNTSNITTNSNNISSNDTDIATNASNIATNLTSINSNTTAISGLDTRVTSAESNITALQGADDVITVQDEGTQLSATVNTLNFTGAGVTASHNAGVATVTIPGGGGGSSSVASAVFSMSVDQTSAQSWTTMSINTELSNTTGGAVAIAADNDGVEFLQTGTYIAYATGYFSTNGNGDRQIALNVFTEADVSLGSFGITGFAPPSGVPARSQCISTPIVVPTPGYEVKLLQNQNSGSNLTADSDFVRLSIIKLA